MKPVRQPKSMFINRPPPEKRTVLIAVASCMLMLFNVVDVFSTLLAVWKAYNVDSQYKV